MEIPKNDGGGRQWASVSQEDGWKIREIKMRTEENGMMIAEMNGVTVPGQCNRVRATDSAN